MIEYARNAPKKMDVDIFLLEYLVYIGHSQLQEVALSVQHSPLRKEGLCNAMASKHRSGN